MGRRFALVSSLRYPFVQTQGAIPLGLVCVCLFGLDALEGLLFEYFVDFFFNFGTQLEAVRRYVDVGLS